MDAKVLKKEIREMLRNGAEQMLSARDGAALDRSDVLALCDERANNITAAFADRTVPDADTAEELARNFLRAAVQLIGADSITVLVEEIERAAKGGKS